MKESTQLLPVLLQMFNIKQFFKSHTVWIFEIAATWNFIKHQLQWQFIYFFIVLIL